VTAAQDAGALECRGDIVVGLTTDENGDQIRRLAAERLERHRGRLLRRPDEIAADSETVTKAGHVASLHPNNDPAGGFIR
jgi:hypothetical protein